MAWRELRTLSVGGAEMGRQYSSVVFVAACAFGVAVEGYSGWLEASPNVPNPTVLRGCLLKSRADTSAAHSKGVIYTLDVTDAADKAQKPSTPAAGAATVARTRYALSTQSSEGAVALAKHVGHHVELTGQVLERLQTVSPSSSKPASETVAAKPLPGAAQRMFQVSALKMIAAKCP
jgi:hypothetical protein